MHVPPAVQRLWRALLLVASRKDFVRVDLIAIGVIHLGAGVVLMSLPGQLLGVVSLATLYDVMPPPAWGLWFLLVAALIAVALRRPGGGIHFAVWLFAVPLAVMWAVGIAWTLSRGSGNAVGVFFFAGLLGWYATTALRLEAPRPLQSG